MNLEQFYDLPSKRCTPCGAGNHGTCKQPCGCACVPGPGPMPTVQDVRAAWKAGRVGKELETLRLRRQGTGPRAL